MKVKNARTRIVAALWSSVLIGAPLLAPLLGVEPSFAGAPVCSVFCGKTATVSGPAHASCLQACRACGGDVSRVCPQGFGGFFGSNLPQICCATGTSCCPSVTGTSTCCPAGTGCVFPLGQCAPGCCVPTCADTCTLGGTGCDAGTPDCFCASTTEGSPACVSQNVGCTGPCSSSAECGPGEVCFRLSF